MFLIVSSSLLCNTSVIFPELGFDHMEGRETTWCGLWTVE